MKIDLPQNQLIYSTVRIIATDGNGTSIGTGFFVTDLPIETNIPYIVTNNHVVENCDTAKFVFCGQDSYGNPVDNRHVTISVVGDLQKRVIRHPDNAVDLCLIYLGDMMSQATQTPYFVCVGTDYFVTNSILENLTAIENVIMIGYPEGLIDHVNNKPVVRKGITATSINLDYEGRKEFVIDMAVFHGSSGSPVFIETTGLSKKSTENGVSIGVKTFYCFAGVVVCGSRNDD